jgi:hypothetical protein
VGLKRRCTAQQAQLADAYIAAGMAAKRVSLPRISSAREPWERANIERFRRALVLMASRIPTPSSPND